MGGPLQSFTGVLGRSWRNFAKVRIDPGDTHRVWLATADGLLVSTDDGRTFDREGGLLFVGQDVDRIVFGSRPNHVMVASYRDLWESFDGGKTWVSAFFGPIHWDIRNLIADRSRPDSFLIATSQEILRFGPGDSLKLSAADVRRYRETIASEPPLMEVLRAALVRAGCTARISCVTVHDLATAVSYRISCQRSAGRTMILTEILPT